jgi:hypothetical protein
MGFLSQVEFGKSNYVELQAADRGTPGPYVTLHVPTLGMHYVYLIAIVSHLRSYSLGTTRISCLVTNTFLAVIDDAITLVKEIPRLCNFSPTFLVRPVVSPNTRQMHAQDTTII